MDTKEELIPLMIKSKGIKRPSASRQICMLVACMYLHFMSLGFSFSLGVIYVELLRYFETEKSVATLVQSFYQGLTAMGGVAFSGAVTKYSAGGPVLVATTVGAGSLFLSAWSVNIYMVIACVGILGGLCMSVNYLCGFVVVGWIFQKNRRSAIAVLTMATAASQTVSPILIGALIDTYGWQGTMIIASGLMLNAIPCGLLLSKSRQYFNVADNRGEIRLKVCECNTGQDIAFTIFVGVCAAYNGTGAVEAWFIVDLSTQRGYTRQAGTALLSVMGALGLVGRAVGTLFLKVCHSYSPTIPMAIAFISFAASHLLVISFTPYLAMLGGALLRGLSVGLLMALQQVMLLELRDIDRFPTALAICNCFIGISQIACGYLGGMIADVTGGYDLAFYIASGTATTCGICMLLIQCLVRVGSNDKGL